LRLKYEAGLSHRAIARACAVGLGTVTAYLQRATAAGLQWPLPEHLDDAALEARLFARPAVPHARDRVVPEWPQLHQELKKPGVTLSLLWLEYRAQHPSGYAYSQFCDRYRRWVGAHVRMLDYFEGSTAIWVPDNLKSGVTIANRYEPEINRTYAELARHYGAVVIPARVATPTDKPKVEVSVQIAQRWVLAVLR